VAWEKRRNRSYFYGSIRSGERVYKVYFGAGPDAEQAADAGQRRREERNRLRESEALERLRLETVLAQALRLETLVRLLTEAALLAVGLRRQNGRPWRRWREGRKTIAAAQGAAQGAAPQA
jgi:hypothetical protein